MRVKTALLQSHTDNKRMTWQVENEMQVVLMRQMAGK